MEPIYTYRNGALESEEAPLPKEYPLTLTVNGREIATLVASPHDLRFLVAGFLRLQGFVDSLDDFLILSVCQDYGAASVQVRKELPERLQPVLTSGCGAGITFSIPGADGRGEAVPLPDWATRRVAPTDIFAATDELARRAENYRLHGGIHSAAIADGDSLLIYAEDIGRHNTVDRIAGEAMFRMIDLAGRMLVTSGRVSSEMAAKAAILGVPLIASRTSPTDMAVKICKEAGITLVGYVRGGRFNVYCHREGLKVGKN